MAENAQYLWNESFALQIPVVDIHLKNLFDLAYQLDCSIEDGTEEQAVGPILERLKEHCQGHFVTQERILSQYSYPGLHDHTVQHDSFTRAVLEFESQLHAGAAGVPQQLAAFLKQWIGGHISVEDKNTVPFILKRVSEPSAGVRGLPVFVEVGMATKHPDTAVCARVSALLMKQRIPHVDSSRSLDHLRVTLKEMASLGRAAAIFVVNTYGAREILVELDTLMGETPVLFLRRALHAGQSGLLVQTNLLATGGAPTLTNTTLGQMKPRLTSMWFYGTKNSALIAQRAEEAIVAFLKTGDFRQIERANPASGK